MELKETFSRRCRTGLGRSWQELAAAPADERWRWAAGVVAGVGGGGGGVRGGGGGGGVSGESAGSSAMQLQILMTGMSHVTSSCAGAIINGRFLGGAGG